MKDKFFKLIEKIYTKIYCVVLKFTYIIFSKRKTKGTNQLSSNEKKEINKYWKKTYGKKPPLIEYRWYKAKNGIVDPKIIPDIIWHSKVEPYFSNIFMEKAFKDKNYFETIIGKENSPDTLVRCINKQLLDKEYQPLKIDEAITVLKNEDEFICKPSVDSGGGREIMFIKKDLLNSELIETLINKYSGDFIIQKIIKQHDFLNQFNKNSINTIRIMTFLYKGKVHFLSAFLRVGGEKSRVDNVSSGGYYINIKEDGQLFEYFTKKNHNTQNIEREEKLNNGFDFKNKSIPNWEKIKNLVYKTHYKLAHFSIINWDVTIQDDEIPIIIEYNLLESSASTHQINNGPILGELTDEVLKEIGKKKGKYNDE